MTTTLKPGDDFPENVKFSYIPYQPENEAVTACGVPQPYDASKGKSAFGPRDHAGWLSYFSPAPAPGHIPLI